MEVRYCGNILEKVQAWHNQNLEKYTDDGFVWLYNYNEDVNTTLGKFIPKKYEPQFNSWFQRDLSSNVCKNIHIDASANMVITSYPHPTEIYIPNKRGFLRDVVRVSCSSKNDISELLEKVGYTKIIPKPGDVYRLCGYVIHKTNEKAKYGPHSVFRAFFGSYGYHKMSERGFRF